MNKLVRTLLLLCLVANSLLAQKKLTLSSTSGHDAYKLTDKETFLVASKSKKDELIYELVPVCFMEEKE